MTWRQSFANSRKAPPSLAEGEIAFGLAIDSR
jgi:hypothetical protein